MVATVTGADISNIKSSLNLNVYYRTIAIESVQNALSNPFCITNSKFTDR